jgi:hypothetical protein
MTILAKIFAAVFAIIVLSRSIVDYRDRKESFEMTIFWIVVWLGISAIAFFPNLVDEAIAMFGGNRSGLGTVFGMGIVFVMFISYRIYIKANRIEKHLNEVSRKYSLLTLEKQIKRPRKASRVRAK